MSNSYQTKIDLAAQAIEQHNSALSAETTRLVWPDILKKLQAAGGTTEEALRELTWEDLEDCDVPRILARRIANQIFRVADRSDGTKPTQNVVSAARISNMSVHQLFEAYDPTGQINPGVTARLSTLADGRRCVVFDGVNYLPAESAKLLSNLTRGMPERDAILVNDKPCPVFKIGEFPNQLFDENFLFAGELLFDGQCSHTLRDLSFVAFKVRQIVKLAITKTGEISVETVDDAHRVLDMLFGISKNATTEAENIAKVEARYPRAAIMLQELLENGTAPTLKLRPNKIEKTGSKPKNDPFGVHYQS